MKLKLYITLEGEQGTVLTLQDGLHSSSGLKIKPGGGCVSRVLIRTWLLVHRLLYVHHNSIN